MRNVLAAAILAVCIPAWADQPVTFAPHDNGFAVSSTATGSVRKDGALLVVALPRHTLRQGKEFKTQTKVIEYRVGLARNNRDGRWDVERWSDVVPVGFTLQPGDTKQLPSTTALIPVDNVPSMQGAWLVVQVKVQREGVVGSTYAHSNEIKVE